MNKQAQTAKARRYSLEFAETTTPWHGVVLCRTSPFRAPLKPDFSERVITGGDWLLVKCPPLLLIFAACSLLVVVSLAIFALMVYLAVMLGEPLLTVWTNFNHWQSGFFA